MHSAACRFSRQGTVVCDSVRIYGLKSPLAICQGSFRRFSTLFHTFHIFSIAPFGMVGQLKEIKRLDDKKKQRDFSGTVRYQPGTRPVPSPVQPERDWDGRHRPW
ncbi:hypothetical protein J6I44_19955 [Aliifodinibius sp. 1BSP15-2V2]|uniref:Uncharacterized protein n=2 Tax=Fodinibius salsisoli TaxID=2820877 RepID=A0ABT3PTH0_9BACT|nr:hypothetical protein [Fodinibius salsisoli]